MDMTQALAALGQDSRLAALRLLIAHAPAPLPAGQIALQLEMRQNTMSRHLGILQAAGLIAGLREGREIRYGLAPGGLEALRDGLLALIAPGLPPAPEPASEPAPAVTEKPGKKRKKDGKKKKKRKKGD